MIVFIVRSKLEVIVPSDKSNDGFKIRVDELIQENRTLKRSVNEAQTNMALQRSEVATLRVQLEEKCYELDTSVNSNGVCCLFFLSTRLKQLSLCVVLSGNRLCFYSLSFQACFENVRVSFIIVKPFRLQMIQCYT